MKLLMVFSLLCACAHIPPPDADACIVNAPAKNRKCYNFSRDYDENGQLKPDAKPIYRSNANIADLNKAFLIDHPNGFPTGLANLKAYIKTLREEYERQCR